MAFASAVLRRVGVNVGMGVGDIHCLVQILTTSTPRSFAPFLDGSKQMSRNTWGNWY